MPDFLEIERDFSRMDVVMSSLIPTIDTTSCEIGIATEVIERFCFVVGDAEVCHRAAAGDEGGRRGGDEGGRGLANLR